ncbi:MAG: nucleotide sugar dehydrogenase [Clostridia bacterium]|nr:nucleotide sugar dehydrogenase [Clostridia bacterium]
MEKICVIGLGHIGLPTAVMFAYCGYDVTGVDKSEDVRQQIKDKQIETQEPSLKDIIEKCMWDDNLKISDEVKESDYFIVAVPTPINSAKQADLTAVLDAAHKISRVLKKNNTVIIESTIPPGCTRNVIVPALEQSGFKAGRDFYVAYCPERVLPSNIIVELINNDRLIGGIDVESAEKAMELYRVFVKGKIFITDDITAEFSKLVENTFRDVNIALTNELAIIADKIGINIWEVIEYANKHPRVNMHFPGPGVGGHCIPVDPWFIVQAAPEQADIIRASRDTNDGMPFYIYKKIRCIIPEGKVVLLGCAYKEDVADTRHSPGIRLALYLSGDERYSVEIVDPHVAGYDKDVYAATCDSRLIVLVTGHRTFRELDFDRLRKVMSYPNIMDTKNFFNGSLLRDKGFTYYLLGDGR